MGFKVKHLFIANAIMAFICGLGWLFMTETMVPMLGVTDNILGFRAFGVPIFCNWILLFFARDSDDNPARKAIVLFEFVGTTLLNIYMFIYLDITIFMVWSTIALNFIFIAGYAYFLFKKE